MKRRMAIGIALACCLPAIGLATARGRMAEDPRATRSDGAKRPSSRIPPDLAEALEQAETFHLYSIDPSVPGGRKFRPEENLRPEAGDKTILGWSVLGRVEVKDPEARRKLIGALQDAAAASDGTVANCFLPRHGIRATRRGLRYDVLICFECLQVQMTEGQRRGGFPITRDAQPAFDKALRDAGVPLAPSK